MAPEAAETVRWGIVTGAVIEFKEFEREFQSGLGKDSLARFSGESRAKCLYLELNSYEYHIQDFTSQGCDPETPDELFNHRYASLRNVIERIFEVFKLPFLIFKSTPLFSYKTQAELVLACAALHNFLRKHCRSDEFPIEEHVEVNNRENMEGNISLDDSQKGEEVFETQDQERESANIWRETMAETMWRNATNNEN